MEPPRRDSGELLLSKLFLDACSTVYAVYPGGQENNGQPFVTKHFNVIDPLRVNNNLGRSVSKGNLSLKCLSFFALYKVQFFFILFQFLSLSSLGTFMYVQGPGYCSFHDNDLVDVILLGCHYFVVFLLLKPFDAWWLFPTGLAGFDVFPERVAFTKY